MLGRPRVLEADAVGGLHDRDLVHDASMFVAVELRQYARAVEEPELHGYRPFAAPDAPPRLRYGARRYLALTLQALPSARMTRRPPLVVAGAFCAAALSLAACAGSAPKSSVKPGTKTTTSSAVSSNGTPSSATVRPRAAGGPVVIHY